MDYCLRLWQLLLPAIVSDHSVIMMEHTSHPAHDVKCFNIVLCLDVVRRLAAGQLEHCPKIYDHDGQQNACHVTRPILTCHMLCIHSPACLILWLPSICMY
jgi:vesicle coat complex subunit